MKRFIKNIIWFGFALLGFLIVCDAITTYAFHQKNTRKFVVWNDIVHGNIDADLIIMGNSRAYSQYSPQIIDSILETSSYNIGIDGSAFNRQYERYHIYRHYNNKKPKYIIQNIEFFTLGYTIGYEREQFMPYLMYPYFRKRIQEVEPFSFGELYIPMYRYYVNNFYDNYTKFDYVVHKGYNGEDNEWDGSKMMEVQPFEGEVDSNSLQMFINYIEETKSEEIDLIFVFAPLYVEVVNKVQNIDDIHKIFYELSEKYDIPILDYETCWISQDTTYFQNATHLNKRGAELFSTILANDIDSLGIIETQH